MRLTRRSSARTAMSAPGVISVTTASQACDSAVAVGTALASIARAIVGAGRLRKRERREPGASGVRPRPAQRFRKWMWAGRALHHARRLHRGEQHLARTAERRAGGECGERAQRKSRRGERKWRRCGTTQNLGAGLALGKRSGRKYIRDMPLPAKLGQPPRSVLWVDDEAELLEPHRLFLADKGYEVVDGHQCGRRRGNAAAPVV